MPNAIKSDARSRFLNTVISQLEAGIRPWQPSWSNGPVTRPLRSCGTPYRGINTIALWMAAASAGYSSPFWLSYKQAQSFGANVRKGERVSTVFFASTYTKEDDKGDERAIPFLKAYTVFNSEQIEGLPGKFNALTMRREPAARLQAAEDFLDNIGADVRHGANRAFYSPANDYIQMPPFEAFGDAVGYYGTSIHEHAHWSGHKDRLDRNLTGKFGDQAYIQEELIAELSAVMVSADLELTPSPRDDHAQYLASWAKHIKDRPTALFNAASSAQRVADYLAGVKPSVEGPAP